MAENRPDDERPEETRPENRSEEQPVLEQWPEDEGSAPHARPDTPSILRLLARGAPRVILAIVLAILYSGAQGSTRLAFLLSWIVVVASMLTPRWRRYVETGQRGKPAKDVPAAEEPVAAAEPEPAPRPTTGAVAEPDAEDELDPRDAWELPAELPEGVTERPKPETT